MGGPSTTHMVFCLSIAVLGFMSAFVLRGCLRMGASRTPRAPAGVAVAGSSPAARVRARAAPDLRLPPPPQHTPWRRSAACGAGGLCLPPVVQDQVQPLHMRPAAASPHIRSAVWDGDTLNPHARGSGLGERNPSLFAAWSGPSWIRSVPWTSAGLIRPGRTSSSAHRAVKLMLFDASLLMPSGGWRGGGPPPPALLAPPSPPPPLPGPG